MTSYYIYDLETFKEVFSCVVYDHQFKQYYAYQLSQYKNDLPQLIQALNFLRGTDCKMVGFNNMYFDYPILHGILQGQLTTLQEIFKFSQAIIMSDDSDKSHIIWQPMIDQLDLMKIHHYDNKARRVSLKQLEFAMRMDSIEELPYAVTESLDEYKISKILDYNKYDVKATYDFFMKSSKEIEFRKSLTSEYGEDYTNLSDSSIGEKIAINRMETVKPGTCYNYVGNRKYKKQTKRDSMFLGDVIHDFNFKITEFDNIYKYLKQQTIYETKGVFKHLKCKYDDVEYSLGLGGLHASVNNMQFITDDEMIVVDVDVASYYPSLTIVNRWHPEHLSDTFCIVNESFFNDRKVIPKSDCRNGAYKLAMNGGMYGKTGSEFSPMFDPLHMMRTTLNGQLYLLLLAEWLLNIPTLKVIQGNTDGITFHVEREYLEQARDVCKNWENHTKLILEEVVYSKMFIRDVNNYFAIDQYNKIKYKGAYCIEPEWHKNHSKLIVARAATDHLINGSNYIKMIKECTNIYDFMIFGKCQKKDKLCIKTQTQEKEIGRFNRYYVANDGYSIVRKLLQDDNSYKYVSLQSGYFSKLANRIEENDHAKILSNINYDYYIKECEKLINGVKKPLSLF